MNNDFLSVGLFDHNINSYKKVKDAFKKGKQVVGIVQATGTGKSYNALQLAYDNKDKKIIYVTPSLGIIEHVKKIIEDNPNLDLKRDFPNLEFRTYQSFISLDKEEIKNIDCNLLILDEFHHLGAPVWGARINTLINTHPEMEVFGMTAYTVRDRGTIYERDMADKDKDELFSNNIENYYDLSDAMLDGILPKPIYKSAYTNLLKFEEELEKRVQRLNATSEEYKSYTKILKDVKRRIQEAPSIPKILKKSIKPNGKYIYFCPPLSEEGTNDIETIKKEALEWFKSFIKEEDIIFFTSTDEMKDLGKKNREAFYNDTTLDGKKINNKLRVMFAINQYNEGIHAPNIDGVIMGRGTTSDIVYFEQLGRALSVRGDTKEKFEKLNNYSISDLKEMCKNSDIPINSDTTKEELIEKLVSPLVIDLTNNYEFIKELENNLRNRIKEKEKKNPKDSKTHLKISNANFDIEIENQDLFEMLRYVSDRLTRSWEDYYELAKAYYEHNGNLRVESNFRTFNGVDFDEFGLALGHWISNQRKAFNNKGNFKALTENKVELLKQIGMIFESIYHDNWMKNYNLAQKYYEHYHNLYIPFDFKTINGFSFSEEGVALGHWINEQRQAFRGNGKNARLTEEKINLLKEIGMVFNVWEEKWFKYYNLAKVYYEHHKNLDVPRKFKTIDGFSFDESGIALGNWISVQRQTFNGKTANASLTEEKIKLLKEIGMRFDDLSLKNWTSNYNLAKAYYEHYGNLLIPVGFKTQNGYDYDEEGAKLGAWISKQRQIFNSKTKEQRENDKFKLLEEIGMVWSARKNSDNTLENSNISKKDISMKKNKR